MSYQEKVQKAMDVIAAHNSRAERKVSSEEFFKKLEADGGTSDDALMQTSWEDLERCGLPRLLAKQVAQIFRATSDGSSRPKYLSEARVQTMTIQELLEAYDPKDPLNFVGKRLAEFAKGEPCIVFDDTNKVQVEASTVLIREILGGYPPRKNFILEGKPVPIFKVGGRPDLYAEENPIYPGRILRPDGTCDQTNRSWKGVPQEVRTLLYLAVSQTKELVISRLDDAHTVIDLALTENALEKLCQRYAQAWIFYERLLKEGKLPTLKRPLSSNGSTERNDPFAAQHKRW